MPKRKAEESPSKEEAVRRSPPRARRPPDRLAVQSYKVDSSDESFASEEESDREENKEADDREENKEDDDKNDDKDDDKDEEGSEYQSKGSDNEDKQSDSDDDADASGDEQEDAASSTKSGDDEEEKRPHKKIKTVTEIFPTECEFCGKMFKNKYGYKYHSENNVCRRGSVTKSHRGKRKKSLASGKSFPKIRGKEEDRVCPHCNKKFTSSLGCQYHVKKGVCFKVSAKTEVVPFATLQPGSKFITPFGVVEVVRDDRAVPVTNPADSETTVKKQEVDSDDEGAKDVEKMKPTRNVKRGQRKPAPDAAKQYRAEMTKRKQQLAKVLSGVTVLGLVRRKELGRAYEAGKLDQKTVWKAQYGDDPRLIQPSRHQRFPKFKPLDEEDPNTPASSFPDRIVECRWVQDTRTRFLGTDDELPPLDEPPSVKDNRPNVFLQRRMLTEPFGVGVVLYICPTCGQKFLSRSGVMYHLEVKKCEQVLGATAKSNAQIKILDDRAIDLLKGKDRRRADGRPDLPASVPGMAIAKPQKPPVDLRLRQALARLKKPPSNRAAKEQQDEMTEPVTLAKTMKEKKMEVSADPNFVDPRKVLADLESQCRHQQSLLIGPMYPGVYKALLFEKPGIKKKRKRRPKSEVDLDKKRLEIQKARQILEQEKAKLALLKVVSPVFFPVDKKRYSQNNNPTKGASATLIPSKETASKTDTPPNLDALRGAGDVKNSSSEPERAAVNVAPATAAPVAGTENDTSERGSTCGNASPSESVPEIPQNNDTRGQDQVLTGGNDTVAKAVPRSKDDAPVLKIAATNEKVAKKRKTPPSEQADFLDSMRARPPMIDTRVIVHEIDAGRYPSINRTVAKSQPKSPASNKCPICKTAEPTLYKCNFCFRKVHITCARLKWTLPDPEPYDDFLCTVCISSIAHRRNRAERRRIERAQGVEAAATSLSVTEMVHPPIPLHRKVEKSLEYETVLSQGRHMANLVDLETDARKRLQREIENTRLSGLRRQMMM